MPTGNHVGTMFSYGYSNSDILGDLVAGWWDTTFIYCIVHSILALFPLFFRQYGFFINPRHSPEKEVPMKKSKALICGLCAVILVFGLVGTANAAIVVEDPEGNALGILGLEIAGTDVPWNVEFVRGTARDLFGDPAVSALPLDSISEAAFAVNSALNDADVTTIIDGTRDIYQILIIEFPDPDKPEPQVLLLESIYNQNAFPDPIWQLSEPPVGPLGTLGVSSPTAYAVFTPVPLPAAVWLLGGGLIGLVGLRRRFKN
jgi:hypothetical protein